MSDPTQDLFGSEALYKGIRSAVGRALEDPIPAFMGWLDEDGVPHVPVENPQPDEIGKYYYTPQYSTDLLDAPSFGTAYNTGASPIPDKLIGFGTPVYVARDRIGGDWYFAGTRPRPTAAAGGTQPRVEATLGSVVMKSGLLDVASPESMSAIVYEAPYTLNRTTKLIGTLYVADQTANIPATAGQAVYVLVEVDFANEALVYTIGDEFDAALTHAQAWAQDDAGGKLFPQGAQNRFRSGYIKLISGMNTITRSLIVAVQEVFTKNDLSNVVTIRGEVATAGGDIVYV